jgi:hypothetical protein
MFDTLYFDFDFSDSHLIAEAGGNHGLEPLTVDLLISSVSDVSDVNVNLDIIDGVPLAGGDSLQGLESMVAFHQEFSHDTESPLRQGPSPPPDPNPNAFDIRWGDIVLLASIFIALGLLYVYFEDV